MNWQQITTELGFLANIVLAGALSAFVGYEREKRDKPAGLRTHIIVGSTTCLFVLISPSLIRFVQQQVSGEVVDTDPTRILQALLVGISFLGAGTIFKGHKEATIRYLTTAATLFYSVALGITVALRHYVLAIGLTLFILLINLIIRRHDKNLSEGS